MRFVAPPTIQDLSPVEAVTAATRGWLIALAAWFCEAVDALPDAAWRCPLVREAYAAAKRRIAAGLRRATGDLRKILFLLAMNAFRAASGRIATHRIARGARCGIRVSRKARRRICRIATAGMVSGMHEGSLRDRIARLRAMMEDPAALIARVLKRLHAIWRAPHGARLVLVASRDACVSLAAVAPRCADSS